MGTGNKGSKIQAAALLAGGLRIKQVRTVVHSGADEGCFGWFDAPLPCPTFYWGHGVGSPFIISKKWGPFLREILCSSVLE